MLKRIPRPHHLGDMHVEGTVYADGFRTSHNAEPIEAVMWNVELTTAGFVACVMGFAGGVVGGIAAVAWWVR